MRHTKQREAAFNHIRDASLAVLTQPQVIDALGEQAEATIGMIEDAFPVHRRAGTLVPPTPEHIGRLGIHPLLQSDPTLPDASKYFATPLPDVDYSIYSPRPDDGFATKLGKTISRVRRRSHHNFVAFVQTDDWNMKESVPQQMVVFVGSKVLEAEPVCVAASLAHEADHVDKLSTWLADPDNEESKAAYGSVDEQRLFLAKLEKSAYPISAAVLCATEQVPDDVSYQSLIDEAAGCQTPDEAVAAIKWHSLYDSTLQHMTPGISAASLAHTCHGAMVASALFGDGSENPTLLEAEVYQRLGLIPGSAR